ncbi:hypothetical protein GGI15_001705 [Coemansia interrupta]|uniref:F-box domain-containing protein n=1 Tax=Coemansia interrupta TaxID=1126814 RepID=A0A9W8LMM5_9FUNG|nr:hypothetical protein GGI15_001705 [Coemansia interrupta]
MDPPRSLFQKLPASIISLIIYFIQDGKRNRKLDPSDKIALAQLSHAWRQVAAHKYLNKLVVDIQDGRGVTYRYPGYREDEFPFKLVSHDYVVALMMQCDVAALESGRAVDWVELHGRWGFVLPKAESLHITLVGRSLTMRLPPGYVAFELYEFIEKVKEQMPNVRIVTNSLAIDIPPEYSR